MNNSKPRIILFDIEATNLNANIGHILCVGWKVYGDKKINVIKIDDYTLFDEDCTDDYAVVKETGEVLSEGDAFVTWYGTRFDVPYINSRLIYHGLPLLPHMTAANHIDGWRTARYKMKLNSNRLATVSAFFGAEEKTPINWRTWARAAAGHRPSLGYVYRHCRQDINVLEQVYEKIRALDHQHFNVNLISKRLDACPRCGAPPTKLQHRGWNYAHASKKRRYQCTACGGWSSGPPVMVKNADVKKENVVR